MKHVLAILILMNSFCYSQELYYEQFTEADGLPSLMTYEMVQDSNGMLWVGTENGLVSYDGDNFQRYSHSKLNDNDIIEIALDKNGIVYFLNLSGQLGYVENEVVSIIDTDTIKGKIIDIIITEEKNYSIVKGLDPVVYKKSLVEFSTNEEGKFGFKNSEYLLFEEVDKKYKPYRYIDSTNTLYTEDRKIIHSSIKKNKVYTTEDDDCIVFNGKCTFYEIDCSIIKSETNKVFQGIVKFGNTVFVVLYKGLVIHDLISKKSQIIHANTSINTVFVDREDNIWVSTPKDGLFKFPYLEFQFETRGNSFIQDYGVNDFIVDDNGELYIATTTGQLKVYSKERKLLKEFNISIDSKKVKLYSTEKYIFGVGGQELFKINKSSKKFEILERTLFGLKSILVKNNLILAGSRSGLYVINFDDFFPDENRKPKGLENKWINALYQDKLNNTLFAGTTSGLFEEKGANNFDLIDLKDDSDINISCLAEGVDNSIWVSTRNKGVLRIKGDTILERFNTDNGLISDIVNAIEVVNDRLIVSTAEGVSIKFFDTGEISTINEKNGVIPKEILLCKLIDGDYWLASNSGITIVKPSHIDKFKKDGPQLSIHSMYANGVKINPKENLEFSYDVNTILINFRNISLRNRKNKSIKYRIKSKDTTWVYSTDPLIRLQSLKYGKYQIEAIGLNAKKEEGNKLSIDFTINPPWWETLWARLLGLLLTIVLISIFVRRRANRIREEESTKRDYLVQINKIKDQALQLQMNPHFIFNSLNAIQGFIGTDDEEMAMNYLARFARLIRLIFEHSKGNTITLEEELEFINLYLDLEKLRFKDKVTVSLTIDPKLENVKDMIEVPPLLIQPIVENSFKHGLFHKKGSGNLHITYALEDSILNVIIQDDGIGRKESKKISNQNSENQTSSGIKTTIERIDLLNFGKDKRLNSAEIVDLYDDKGNAVGTKTILKLEVSQKQ